MFHMELQPTPRLMSETNIRPEWALCEACGHWQRSTPASRYGGTAELGSQLGPFVALADRHRCEGCGWHTTLKPVDPVVGSALRFLVGVEVRSDGSWHVAELRSARLPMIVEDESLLRNLRAENGPIRHLHAETDGRMSVPAVETWQRFRKEAMELVRDACNEGIRASWPAPAPPPDAPATLFVRCLALNPDLELAEALDDTPSWLTVVPFETAAADAACTLNDDDVTVTCEDSIVRLGDGGNHVKISLRAPCELLVEGCTIVSGSSERTNSVWHSDHSAICYRDVWATLPDVLLTAEAVRGLALNSGNCIVQVVARGRDRPFEGTLAVEGLPARTHVANLFLDLGSTTTKWALCFDDDAHCDEHDQDTESLSREWAVQPYRKSDLIADPSGREWTMWLAQALPALRNWVGREHGAYLARVVVSLPSTPSLHVDALSSAVRLREHEHLSISIDRNLVDGGEVRLEPEHTLLTRYYMDVLDVLRNAANTYRGRYDTARKARAAQKSKLKTWETQRRRQAEYEGRSWFGKLWALTWEGKPKERGTRPKVPGKPTAPDDWMLSLLERPDQLDRVVLLDAGGLSLDVAVLELSDLVRDVSGSFDNCGGEELSRRIGRGKAGNAGTRTKAQLGLMWREAPDSRDRAQREYIEATRSVYEAELRTLVTVLGKRWKGFCSLRGHPHWRREPESPP